MKYYIDCEFDGHRGKLLSIAMVREDGVSMHHDTMQPASDPWVRENVVPIMNKHEAEHWSIGGGYHMTGYMLREFIGDDEHPVIISDSPVDIARFTQAITTNVTGDWQTSGYPRMTFEVHNVDCYPTTLENAVQHNAWWDAMALREKLRD